MAATGGGRKGGGVDTPGPNVTDLLSKLNLTEEEGAVADFSDDEEGMDLPAVEWALVGKVLSPLAVHVNTVRSAMKPAWGNPAGLKFRTIGEKHANLFVAEFKGKVDMERVLLGTPWMVGRHAVILQKYDERLSASEIVFDHMEIWVHILNLPLSWMNQQRGSRAMSLTGKVVKMDVDGDGKASGAFLRGRVAIEIDKPLRRGVLLRMSKTEDPRLFAVQYEKLPFFCFACGVMGHSEVECDTPVERNEDGKLPYDVQLRAPEERRRRVQSFAGAAADSFGSGSSSVSRPPRGKQSRQEGSRSSMGEEDTHFSSPDHVGDSEELEVQSPLKQQAGSKQGGAPTDERNREVAGAGKKLFQQEGGLKPSQRKRKSKMPDPMSQTPDLNIPLMGSNTIVPVGIVNSRINQLDGGVDGGADSGGESMIETLKRQKRGNTKQTARSAGAADRSSRRAQ